MTSVFPRLRLVVVGGILWRKETFLATQRPKGRSHEGLWEFPGGKVEPGETLEAALIRELHEELSLVVPSTQSCRFWRTVEHDYPQQSVILHFFHITDFTGEPVSNDGQSFRWVTPAEARALPFLKADRPLLDELISPF